jgi:glycosyltransferase involved in cell wall biosynthesis
MLEGDLVRSLDPTLVSVIVPSYNSAAFVCDAVQSALAQTYPHVEVIVVDDGSTDNTREVLAPYAERITYVFQKNKGLPGARNTGIERARGAMLAFLDADDQWTDTKLAEQVPVLLSDPEIGLVHTDLQFFDAATGRRYYEPRRRERLTGRCYAQLLMGNQVTPSTVLARTEAVIAVGCFDETLTSGCEDWDLWLRLARHHSFGYLPAQSTIYRLHGNNMTRKALQMHQAVLYVVEKALRNDPELAELVGGAPKVRPYLARLQWQVGHAAREAGQAARARKHIWSAVRLNPWLPEYWRGLAASYLRSGA